MLARGDLSLGDTWNVSAYKAATVYATFLTLPRHDVSLPGSDQDVIIVPSPGLLGNKVRARILVGHDNQDATYLYLTELKWRLGNPTAIAIGDEGVYNYTPTYFNLAFVKDTFAVRMDFRLGDGSTFTLNQWLDFITPLANAMISRM